MDWRRHWAGRERYTVLVGSYRQAEIDRCIAHWREDPQRPHRLHIIAIADGPLPGFERIAQQESAITVDLLHAPLLAALAQLQARIDAVSIDDFDDADVPRALARLLARNAVLQAPALAPAQWQALAASGWIDDGGTLRFASRKPMPPAAPAPVRRALVIGAGLAGAAICERLCARGWQVTLVERRPAAAMEASGNLAGIGMPLLSKDDNRASRLSRAAFVYAGAYWRRLGGVGVGGAIEGDHCGVLLAARDGQHAALQRAIAAANHLPAAYAEWVDAEQAASRFGAVAPHGAWLFPQGGWIRPASAVAAMLAACGANLTTHFGVGDVHLLKTDEGWTAVTADNRTIASAPTVIVASGGGAIAQTAALPLDRVRGQVTHLAAGTAPDLGFVLCREAYLTPAAGGIASAGATYDDDADPALRQSSQDQNLAHLRSMLADDSVAREAPLAGRVGFRAVAPDRLPMVGAVPEPDFDLGAERLRDLPRQPGVYALLGYASRGLTWAPLAAELLAASLEHEPLPVEAELAAALDPGRFMLRARRGKAGGLR